MTDRDAGLRAPLLEWFDAHKRDLPWRHTSDPYAIWVSEIMLQQTQVATVVPFYERWMSRFPTVEALASAEEQDVLSLWQGLGYYRRCRMLLTGARWVVEHGMPGSARDWLNVPGVGRYTAAAIASIAFGEAAPLVDGNVERVFSRITECAADGAPLHERAWEWASGLVPAERPGDWNQALMELGATICRPVDPRCLICPVFSSCRAAQGGRQSELPVRTAKPAVVELRHVVWVPWWGGKFGLRQIPAGQWWEGMWEFPRADVTGGEGHSLESLVGKAALERLGSVQHTVTNHRITIEAHLARVAAPTAGLCWYDSEELGALPISAPQRRVLALALRALG